MVEAGGLQLEMDSKVNCFFGGGKSVQYFLAGEPDLRHLAKPQKISDLQRTRWDFPTKSIISWVVRRLELYLSKNRESSIVCVQR